MSQLDPDQKMSIEEAASKADAMLENIDNNLKKILSTEVKSESTNQSGFYKSGTANVSNKRQHFADNLELIKEARAELNQAVRENLENSKLVSPEKHSP